MVLRRVLFIRTDRLGETLLNLPAVAALKAALPGSRLTLLVHPDVALLLAGGPGLDDVLAVPSGTGGSWWGRAWRLGRALSRHRFDAVLVSNPKQELHAAVWLAGIPVRVGYNRKWGWMLTHRLDDRKALGDRHEVEYNLDLVRALDLPVKAVPWSFPSLSQELDEVFSLPGLEALEPSDPLIMVHPFSSNPLKRWPAERYRELLRQLAQQGEVRVVIIGGQEEQEHVSSVLPADVPVVNLVGRLTLRQLAGLLQRTQLLVSNDSGPVHLAAAVGTRTVVLFGSTQPATGPGRWGPWGSGHVVIAKSSLTDIMVNEVVEAVRGVLSCPHPAAS